MRMRRIHGPGLHSFAQTGRNTLRRDHFQSLPQDWPEQSEVPSEASSQGGTTDLARKRRKVRQPETKEELVCEEFSPTKTFVHTTGKGGRGPSRSIRARRQRSAAGASQQWEYIHKTRWNSMD